MQKTKPHAANRTALKQKRAATAQAKKHAGTKTKRTAPVAAAKAANRHIRRLHHLHFGLTSILVVATFVALLVSLGASNAQTSATTTCTVSATLVNSCRPWLGAAVNGYPGGTGLVAQTASEESRIGRPLDIVHDYRTPGQVMSADDQTLAKRANTILLMNWKPSTDWGSVNANNATVTSQIDAMANSIKSLGSTKIMLTIFHEAENDVSPGGDPNCNITYKGTDGSVADYTSMWHYVHDRMVNTDHVTNVVWVMNYMGYSAWDCLVNDMWPGNSYVDWVMWDTYDTGSGNFLSTESRFYNVLTANSNIAHDYLSKPWGLAEWGSGGGTQASAYALYDSAKTTLDNNSLPRLKAYVIWDSNSNGDENQTQYDRSGNKDQTEQDHYNAFAQDPRFTDAYYGSTSGGGGGGTTPPPAPAPTPDKTAPTVSLTAPSNGANLSGTVTVTGTASDNVGVTDVTLRVDDVYVVSDTTAPYSFSLDTTKFKPGNHTVTLRAWDAANNMGQSSPITVTIVAASGGSTGGTIVTPPVVGGAPPTTVIVFGGSPTANTIPVKGILQIAPATNGGTVSVQVDGKAIAGDSVNTAKLTDGTHTVTVSENGQTMTQKITVDNPWPTATLNRLKAHPAAYTSGGIASLAMLVLLGWFGRTYSTEIIEAIRTRKFVQFASGGRLK